MRRSHSTDPLASIKVSASFRHQCFALKRVVFLAGLGGDDFLGPHILDAPAGLGFQVTLGQVVILGRGIIHPG